MEELIKTFHIDWKLILAQLVNFGIVIFVIYKFFWPKIKNVLEDRAAQVSESLRRSKEIEDRLAKIKTDQEAMRAESQREAQSILAEAQKMSKEERERILNKTKDEAGLIIQQAKIHLTQEKQTMKEELLGEMKELVVAATTKVLQQVMNKELEDKVVKTAIKELKRHE
ncbi:MAG: F0F1 ATP synthase subunit B [Candidatus Komeilibacteria bacterium]|nr:F0F1 ATP synthase subunit B [Candidatus Komeilibacteria bacterium]